MRLAFCVLFGSCFHATTDNRLQRLVGQGEIEKIGRGQYRYRRSASSEATPM
jgi:hypothetical protein